MPIKTVRGNQVVVPKVAPPVVPRVSPRFDVESAPAGSVMAAYLARQPENIIAAGTPSLLSSLPAGYSDYLTPHAREVLAREPAYRTYGTSRTGLTGTTLNPRMGTQAAVHEAMHVLNRESGGAMADIGIPAWMSTGQAASYYLQSPWMASARGLITRAQFALSPSLRNTEVQATAMQEMYSQGIRPGGVVGAGYTPQQMAGLRRYFTYQALQDPRRTYPLGGGQ